MATWLLDPNVTHLNHGSFGACPTEVLAEQQRFRDALERNPVGFQVYDYQPALERSREAVATFVGADPASVVFVENATAGVNAVLRSLETRFAPGDEVLVTDHTYNACRNAAEVSARRFDGLVRVAEVPFPIDDPQQAIDAVLGGVSERTALVLIDHVTSPTGLVMPVAEIVAALEPDIPVLVDAAHAPGMIDLDLEEIGASFTSANCHKWLCSPKGAGFLHVAERHREHIHAAVVSHGWNDGWPNSGSRFHALFDWTGTDDPSARLCVAKALDVMEASHAGGWAGIRSDNHDLVLRGRAVVADALGVDPPVPPSMIGSIASLPIVHDVGASTGIFDPLMFALHERWSIEVPVFAWPDASQRLLRISAQQYNRMEDYERLAEALSELGAGGKR